MRFAYSKLTVSLIESLEDFLRASPPPLMSDLTQTIGRYQISRELGRGMMGVVYLAHDPDLGRDIALKVIQLPQGASAEDKASFEQRFFAEARSAARLSHSGIVIVHDVGRDNFSGDPFMALQFVPGKTLESILKDKRRLDPMEALRICKGVADALQHAHSQGVVHRDIKPANIMILPNGDPMIMDFGIAKLETSRMTATGQFVGTPLYMSPEQAMVHPVDGRSDIFSLGSVLYEMLTGVPAFYGESITKILLQLIHNEPQAPSTVVATLPKSVDHILSRSLAKDVHRRYQTAGEMADDLKDVLEAKDPRSMTLWPVPAPLVGTDPQATPGPWVAGTLPGLGPAAASALNLDWQTETHALPRSTPPASAPPQNRVIEGTFVGAVFALVGVLWLVVSFSIPAPESRPFQIGLSTPVPTPSSVPTIAATPTPVPPEPAQVALEFEHSLKSGVLRVFLDNAPVIRQNLDAKVTKRIIGIPFRKGVVSETLQVPPGKHTIKVQVAWDDNIKTEETQTTFKAGGRLRLKAKLGGRLRKDLSIEWK